MAKTHSLKSAKSNPTVVTNLEIITLRLSAPALRSIASELPRLSERQQLRQAANAGGKTPGAQNAILRRRASIAQREAGHQRADETAARKTWYQRQRQGTAKKTKPAAQIAKVEQLGKVLSINASLCIVISDAALAREYGGIEGPEGDLLKGSDWHQVLKAIGSKTTVRVEIGGGKGLALALGVGQGTADVFARDGGLVLIESFTDDEDELLELAQRPRAKDAKARAEVEITSGAVVLTPSTDGCRDVKAKIKLGQAKECGDDDSGLLIGVNPGRYTLWVEKGRDNARRAHLVPTLAAS